VALDHGFQTALYGLTGLLLLGALITVTLVRSTPARKEHAQPVDGEVVALEEAA
jgi:F0F1-type ATP synthase assembly protein I